MRLHSDILTAADLHAATPDEVIASVSNHGSRKRARAFEVSLEGLGDRHTRKKNSGQYGAGYEFAASWDDWGIWLAALYEIDPNLNATYYTSREDFYAQTARYQPRGMTAPWLTTPRGRLEHLRGALRAESISYGELVELQGLTDEIDESDVELREAAGLPEFV
jgi:hypothetical protein